MFEEKQIYPWLKAIVAIGDGNRVIANGLKLPWNYPEEYQYYLDTTKDGERVMGRVTYDTHKEKPKGVIYILSQTMEDKPDVHIIRDFKQLPKPEEGKIMWVCGGAEVYKTYLPFCSELYLTHIHGNFEGDRFFPEYEHLFTLEKTVIDRPEYTAQVYSRNIA